MQFAVSLMNVFMLPRVAQPHLEAARDESQETVVLKVYDQHRQHLFTVGSAESRQPVRYNADSDREPSPVQFGASGKAILAFLPEAQLEAILASIADPVPVTSGPVAKSEFRRQLSEARQRGWAASVGERTAGARGVAAPIHNAAGHVAAAVTILWADLVTDDVREPKLGDLAVRTAEAISLELGHTAGA